MHRLDPLDARLLDGFQRDLPLVPRPFAAIGDALAIGEGEVIARLARLQATGAVARVGATVRPNTAGASTLAAMSVPEARAEEIGQRIAAEPGVNHAYQREDSWNLWFVATAPSAPALAESLARIRAATGFDLLDLRLVRPFNIDLGFPLSDAPRPMRGGAPAETLDLTAADRPILHALSQGLALVPTPFAALAKGLGLAEDAVLARLGVLLRARVITRLGVIVRHRPLGFTANAMVVWDLPEHRIDPAGLVLSALPGITLCYRRRPVPGVWPFSLYAMIHGRARSETLAVLDRAQALPDLAGTSPRVLFSSRCFKQTGARIAEAA